jgi:hypothetical protein
MWQAPAAQTKVKPNSPIRRARGKESLGAMKNGWQSGSGFAMDGFPQGL